MAPKERALTDAEIADLTEVFEAEFPQDAGEFKLCEGQWKYVWNNEQRFRDWLRDPQVSASMKAVLEDFREKEQTEPEPEQGAEIAENIAAEEHTLARTHAAPLSPKLLTSAINIALSTLGIKDDAVHRDDLRSDGMLAIALHVDKGGRLDQALLVTIAKRQMIDYLRANKRYATTQFGQEDLFWDNADTSIWDRVAGPAPKQGKKKRKKAAFLWVTRLFYDSGYFNAPRKAQAQEAMPDPDGPDWDEYRLEQDILELACEEESPAEIVRRLSNRYDDPDLPAKLPLPKVEVIIRKGAAWEREGESAEMDDKIFELAEQGLNQTEMGDVLNISQVAVHKRIKQIEARYQTWIVDGRPNRL